MSSVTYVCTYTLIYVVTASIGVGMLTSRVVILAIHRFIRNCLLFNFNNFIRKKNYACGSGLFKINKSLIETMLNINRPMKYWAKI